MRAHLINATSGVLDYAAYPAGMLLLAPVIIRHCGTAGYGVWTIATGLVSTGAILASGFGDAGLQAIAAARGRGDAGTVGVTVRAMMTIHILLGAGLGVAVWMFSDAGARWLQRGDAVQVGADALMSLRVASALLFLRALEAGCVSTQRGFEGYAAAVSVSLAGRTVSLVGAGLVALTGRSISSMLGGVLLVQMLSVALQVRGVAKRLGWPAVLPSHRWVDVSRILQDGRFTWLIAAGGVLFAYADRLLLGFSRGATSVVAYALCIQIAQPIHGLVANALHFLFPYFARVNQETQATEFARIVRRAVAANVVLSAVLCVAVGFVGWPLLRIFAGNIVKGKATLMATVVGSFGLLSASVVGGYALVGIGRARDVAAVYWAGAAGMLALMPVMLRLWGPEGLASARLVFGCACLLLYVPLVVAIRRPATERVCVDGNPTCVEGGEL